MIKLYNIFLETVNEKQKNMINQWVSKIKDVEGVDRIIDWNSPLKHQIDFIKNNFFDLRPKLSGKSKDIRLYSVDEIPELYDKLMNILKNTKRYKKQSNASKVYEDDNWLIILPGNYLSFCYYGSDTKWCTTKKSNYDMYRTASFVEYIIINKNIKERSANNKYNVGVIDNKIKDVVNSADIPIYIQGNLIGIEKLPFPESFLEMIEKHSQNINFK
jgi:hypothetical protein